MFSPACSRTLRFGSTSMIGCWSTTHPGGRTTSRLTRAHGRGDHAPDRCRREAFHARDRPAGRRTSSATAPGRADRGRRGGGRWCRGRMHGFRTRRMRRCSDHRRRHRRWPWACGRGAHTQNDDRLPRAGNADIHCAGDLARRLRRDGQPTMVRQALRWVSCIHA